MNIFRKLDKAAERWLNAIDGNLQQPIVQTMTGEVFTHGAPRRQTTAVQTLDIDVDAIAACEAVAGTVLPDVSPLPAPNTGTSLMVT
jgi:hypothetical protein